MYRLNTEAVIRASKVLAINYHKTDEFRQFPWRLDYRLEGNDMIFYEWAKTEREAKKLIAKFCTFLNQWN